MAAILMIVCLWKKVVKDSIWTYYHRNDVPSYKEVYEKGNLISYNCYDSLGNIQSAKCDSRNVMPEFPGDLNQYLSSHMRFPEGYGIKRGVNGSKVVVKFIIYEDGSIHDVEIVRAFHPAFDAESIRVISNMPKWVPGKQYNRAVKVSYTISLGFEMED